MINPSFIKKIFLCTFIMVFTMVTMINVTGAILSVIQLLFILYLILGGQWHKALLYHFVFWSCSMSVASASYLFENNHDLTMYNYCRLELYGPLKFSYIVSVILWIKATKLHNEFNKTTLFYKLYKVMLFLMVSGTILGCLGFIFDSNYSLDGCVTYGMYIALSVISLYTFLKFDSLEFKKIVSDWAIAVLIAAVYAVAICFTLGYRSIYSTQEKILATDMWYFVSILIPAFFVVKERIHCLLAICIMIPFYLFASGGKTILILGIVLLFFMYNCFFIDKTLSRSEQLTRKRLRFICILVFCFILYTGIFDSVNSGQLTQNKTNDVLSLFTLDVNKMGRSPAIRFATLMNIVYNNRYNPICILFGNGYGGYFTDELGLFNGLEVWKGGWSEDMCIKGIYTSGHDTFAAVPLVNGLWGLILILKIVVNYLKSFRKSFLVLAVVPWLLLTFYANINYSYIAIFLLYASTYYLDNNIK